MNYNNQSSYFNSNQLKRFILYRQIRTNKLISTFADISNANINHAYIKDADISNANINHAYIKDADISDADISFALIHDLQVKKADIENLNVHHDITLNNNPYLPIGIILPYATNTAPEGWLVCDGQEVSKTTYSSLENVIGNTFGFATNPDNFKLPDLRGRVIVGSGTGSGLSARSIGQLGGAETHTLTENEMPSHTHTGTTSTNGSHTHQLNMVQKDDGNFSNEPGQHPVGDAHKFHETKEDGHHMIDTESSGTHTHTLNINNTGGGNAHNNMQPFLVLNYIIKYRV